MLYWRQLIRPKQIDSLIDSLCCCLHLTWVSWSSGAINRWMNGLPTFLDSLNVSTVVAPQLLILISKIISAVLLSQSLIANLKDVFQIDTLHMLGLPTKKLSDILPIDFDRDSAKKHYRPRLEICTWKMAALFLPIDLPSWTSYKLQQYKNRFIVK